MFRRDLQTFQLPDFTLSDGTVIDLIPQGPPDLPTIETPVIKIGDYVPQWQFNSTPAQSNMTADKSPDVLKMALIGFGLLVAGSALVLATKK